MASLRDAVKDYRDELRAGIAWVAFWREGRSRNSDYIYLETDDTLTSEDRGRLQEIQTKDPAAVVLNGYYCGYLGEEMNLDGLTAGVRRHYENSYNNIADFIEAHDDRLPPEVILEAAYKNGMVESNPARRALRFPKDKKIEKRILTEQEEAYFLDYISNNGWYKRYVPLFTVGFGTGIRIGEILALTWKDIDFENKVIHVNKTLVRLRRFVTHEKMIFIINEPKMPTSIRDVPMLGKVEEALRKQKKICPECKVTVSGYTDFVFLTRTGNVFDYGHIDQAARTIAESMNKKEIEVAEKEGRTPINFEKFSCHCMRHTFATRCYEKGMREKVIQKILEHSKLDMTLNVYTHVTDEMIEEDIKKLEETKEDMGKPEE